jgi:hypothetical protein
MDSRKQRSSYCLLHSSLVLGLPFSHEDGDMSPRNVRWLSPDYMALYARRYNSS